MDRGSIQVAMKKAVIEAGVGLRTVQDALGHASPTTTVRYVHLTDIVEADVRRAADQMAQQLGERIFPWIWPN